MPSSVTEKVLVDITWNFQRMCG